MKQSVSVITLPVADLQLSRHFYCDGLGWVPAFENDEVIFFQINGLVLALFLKTAFEADLQGATLTAGNSFALGHNVGSRAEADAVFAAALAAGARTMKTPRPTSWGGYAGYFADPDGHLWEVAHNPFWPISEEGYVRFAT
jgi:catechol 2,3-dioxygenase-like lactoylglutathione lyase family enzyme